MTINNKSLRRANKVKNDEFYTLLSDIEKEMKYYNNFFEGKVVFCNCDDPEYSNFWKYFELNFEKLNIKKLIATHYCENDKSYKLELFKKNNELVKKKEALEGDGDFRSEECKLLLKQCDVVVTNPPFSLFREFVSLLIEYKKKFLIIGSENARTYKEIFPLIMEDKLWSGYNKVKEFLNGNGESVKFGNVCWFTNFDIDKRHEKMILYKKYSPEIYPRYDNFNAINVDKVIDIPCDYDGFMGVPITFLDKYNPDQFSIIDGLNRYAIIDSQNTNEYVKRNKLHTCNIAGKATYFRIIIKRRGIDE